MAPQSARRDRKNQGFPPCYTSTLMGDLDPVRELPYRLAALIIAASEAGQMAASDQVSDQPKNRLRSRGASTDGKRTLRSYTSRHRGGALQRAFVALGLVSLALLNGCDQSTYGGMDGSHALAKANTLPLPDAYSFYLASYKGVHPPMLDVAPTFSRFGSKGTAYLSSKALETQDRQEFEADLHALLILDYHCDQTLTDALANKSKRMSANTPAGHAHNLGLVPGMGRSYGKFGWE